MARRQDYHPAWQDDLDPYCLILFHKIDSRYLGSEFGNYATMTFFEFVKVVLALPTKAMQNHARILSKRNF